VRHLRTTICSTTPSVNPARQGRTDLPNLRPILQVSETCFGGDPRLFDRRVQRWLHRRAFCGGRVHAQVRPGPQAGEHATAAGAPRRTLFASHGTAERLRRDVPRLHRRVMAFTGSLRGYMLTGACRIAATLQLGMWPQFAVTLNV